ncbi:hypothetical protein KCU81_g10072, partial [Aureobasidium melanogenum]|uniref:Uncharacterized protein n=2 Tax=Aureobasidium melanogenum TaxID=46634 RepID=A0A074VA71_AURM1
MATSAAAHTLLNVLDQSDTSVAANTAAQTSSAPNAESELSLVPPSAHTTPRSTRSRKTRGSHNTEVVEKQAPKRPKPPPKPSAPKSRVLPSPPTRSTTTEPITLKSSDKLLRDYEKNG